MMYSPSSTFSKPMPPPNVDRRKLYKNFLCGICDKIIKKAAILRMCSCRFCHTCILAAYQLGEKTCPHPNCTQKPKPQLRSAADVLLNPPFDKLVTMCGFEAHQSKEDFLDSVSLAKLASQNVQKVMVNRKRPYEAPPDLAFSRKTTFKSFDNQLEQPKNSFDLDNSLLKAFMNKSCSVQPIQSSFAKNRWILAKQRLRDNQNGGPNVMKKRVLGATSDSEEESDMESNISGYSWKRQTETNENDQEESDISDSTTSEMEFENEEPKAEEKAENGPSTSQELTQQVPNEEDERLEKAAREIYLAEQQRIRAMAELEDPKYPLVLWPDMRLELKEIHRRQLHAHYLFVPNSCTMETLGKFVLLRLFHEEDIDFEQEELTVAFVPVVEEVEATNIVILKRETMQDPSNQEKSKDHAVTLKIENPHQASVLIFDYPSMIITKKSTMAQVRAELWKDHSKPMKLVYQIKLKSSEKSPFTSTESPLHTPITIDAPVAITPTSSTNTSTPSDPAPTTPKEQQLFTLPIKQNSNDLSPASVQMMKNEAPMPPKVVQNIEPKPLTLTTLPTTFVPPQIPPSILPSGMRSYPFPPLTSPLPTAPLILQNRANIPFLAASSMVSNMGSSSIEHLTSPIVQSQHASVPKTIPPPADPRVEIGGNNSRNSSAGDSDGMPTLDPEI